MPISPHPWETSKAQILLRVNLKKCTAEVSADTISKVIGAAARPSKAIKGRVRFFKLTKWNKKMPSQLKNAGIIATRTYATLPVRKRAVGLYSQSWRADEKKLKAVLILNNQKRLDVVFPKSFLHQAKPNDLIEELRVLGYKDSLAEKIVNDLLVLHSREKEIQECRGIVSPLGLSNMDPEKLNRILKDPNSNLVSGSITNCRGSDDEPIDCRLTKQRTIKQNPRRRASRKKMGHD